MWLCRRHSLCLLLLTLTAFSTDGAAPKRVLIIHSFGSTAPPFATASTAFETTLTEEMGERIDLDEVSLDMARYAQPDMQEAFAEFLTKRLAKWQPDLVVPVGLPAGRYVAQYHDRLFPQTPVLCIGMDRRMLPPDALATNASIVGHAYDVPGLAEDVFQIAPDTTNLVVVIGSSPHEQRWAEVIHRAFEPFTNRAAITFLSDMSFDQMRERVATLPPRSFIFLPLLQRDATGVTLNQDEALRRLHAVANAPIHAVFRHQLGMGIVGGRLYDAEALGVEAARVAIRVLHGEPASSFPPQVVPRDRPRYDWRELRRWKISEDRLPPGSEILFREPTFWERYRWEIIGIVSITLAEAALIILLVCNLVKRRRTEHETQALRQELTHISRVATMGELTASIAHELNQPLTAILSNAQAGLRFMASGNPDLNELRDILKDIVADDQRAGQVIRHLRSLLKKGETERRPLDLNNLITDVVSVVRSDAALRNVSIQLDLAARLPVVRGDRVQLLQVILNLVVNAFDAMAEVADRPRTLILRTHAPVAHQVQVDVVDNGPGIAAEKIDSIFEPFFTTKSAGMGMGLSVSRSIVTAHEGRLWAENHPEGGAVFHLMLPAMADEKAG